MRKVLLLVVLVSLLLAGCVKPPSLQDDFLKLKATSAEPSVKETQTAKENASSTQQKQETTPEGSTEEGSSQTKKGDHEPTAKEILAGKYDYVKVTTKGESSEIEGEFLGVHDTFTVPYTDIDAIIFDIAQHFGVTLNKVRLVLEVDGNEYLRPSEKETLKLEEEGQQSVFNTTESSGTANPYADLAYQYVRNESEPGFIRAVACDLDNRVLKYRLHNFKDEVVHRYREVKPAVDNPLTIYFNNKRLVDSFCDGLEDLQPNQTVDCYHSDVTFTETQHSGSVYDEIQYRQDLQDKLVATQPGYNEQFPFLCEPSSENATAT